jgi:hypothetical protein
MAKNVHTIATIYRRPRFKIMNITTTTSETVDLAPFFFTGPSFHWPNIAVSLAEWPNPQWATEPHSAHMVTDTRDLFWLRFKDIGLNVDNRAIVSWNQAVWLPEDPRGFYVTSPIVLPTDPEHLLILLGLESHPEAGDIVQFWLALQKFLPFLTEFMENVTWPDPNLMKLL